MGRKIITRKGPARRHEATEVFRQFAWNIAGTLRKSGAGSAAGSRPDRRA